MTRPADRSSVTGTRPALARGIGGGDLVALALAETSADLIARAGTVQRHGTGPLT